MPVDISKYETHFKKFLKEEENKPIIQDIIKMYLFIKNSFYDSKFYEKSNAKDFFEKFKNQITVTQLFSEETLRKIVSTYFKKINTTFDLININILKGKINLKFEKKDFINAKDNLNQKLKKNKIIFNKLIDSKYQNMENEYDNLIKDFKNGNRKKYKKDIEETTEKINKIKNELQEKLNEEFKNFTQELLSELNFIGEKLRELEINKEKNANNINMFESVNDTELNVFKGLGIALLSPIAIVAGGAYVLTDSVPATVLLTGVAGYAALTYVSTTALAVGGLAGLGIAGVIHGGFFLYKKLTEKSKYIEFVEQTKKELITSCSYVKKDINEKLEKIKNQIESAVEKFETIFFSKNEGIKEHKEKWLDIFNQFKKLALKWNLLK